MDSVKKILSQPLIDGNDKIDRKDFIKTAQLFKKMNEKSLQDLKDDKEEKIPFVGRYTTFQKHEYDNPGLKASNWEDEIIIAGKPIQSLYVKSEEYPRKVTEIVQKYIKTGSFIKQELDFKKGYVESAEKIIKTIEAYKKMGYSAKIEYTGGRENVGKDRGSSDILLTLTNGKEEKKIKYECKMSKTGGGRIFNGTVSKMGKVLNDNNINQNNKVKSFDFDISTYNKENREEYVKKFCQRLKLDKKFQKEVLDYIQNKGIGENNTRRQDAEKILSYNTKTNEAKHYNARSLNPNDILTIENKGKGIVITAKNNQGKVTARRLSFTFVGHDKTPRLSWDTATPSHSKKNKNIKEEFVNEVLRLLKEKE